MSLPGAHSTFTQQIVALIARLGRHSYSVYLWHMPVITIMVPIVMKLFGVGPSAAIEFVIYAVASILGGVLAAKAIEFPALALRDRCFPPDTGRRASVPSVGGTGSKESRTPAQHPPLVMSPARLAGISPQPDM